MLARTASLFGLSRCPRLRSVRLGLRQARHHDDLFLRPAGVRRDLRERADRQPELRRLRDGLPVGTELPGGEVHLLVGRCCAASSCVTSDAQQLRRAAGGSAPSRRRSATTTSAARAAARADAVRDGLHDHRDRLEQLRQLRHRLPGGRCVQRWQLRHAPAVRRCAAELRQHTTDNATAAAAAPSAAAVRTAATAAASAAAARAAAPAPAAARTGGSTGTGGSHGHGRQRHGRRAPGRAAARALAAAGTGTGGGGGSRPSGCPAAATTISDFEEGTTGIVTPQSGAHRAGGTCSRTPPATAACHRPRARPARSPPRCFRRAIPTPPPATSGTWRSRRPPPTRRGAPDSARRSTRSCRLRPARRPRRRTPTT